MNDFYLGFFGGLWLISLILLPIICFLIGRGGKK